MPKILVVDDEVLIRMDMVDRLHDVGFTTYEAGHADDALAILESNPDVLAVFTDVNMPGPMNGLELAHRIRQQWPAIFIVISSGHTYPMLADMPNGALFFAKPYLQLDFETLLHKIGHMAQ